MLTTCALTYNKEKVILGDYLFKINSLFPKITKILHKFVKYCFIKLQSRGRRGYILVNRINKSVDRLFITISYISDRTCALQMVSSASTKGASRLF